MDNAIAHKAWHRYQTKHLLNQEHVQKYTYLPKQNHLLQEASCRLLEKNKYRRRRVDVNPMNLQFLLLMAQKKSSKHLRVKQVMVLY